MHGVTKSVTLQVASDGIGNGMDGKRVAGFDITGTINRQDFWTYLERILKQEEL
jgi:polyisoprenoid-binding protein YceI